MKGVLTNQIFMEKKVSIHKYLKISKKFKIKNTYKKLQMKINFSNKIRSVTIKLKNIREDKANIN